MAHQQPLNRLVPAPVLRYTPCCCAVGRNRTENPLEHTDHPVLQVEPKVETAGRRRTLLGACFVINILFGVYLGAVGVLLPRIGMTFHINSAEQGKILSAGFAGSCISVPVCGYLSDRIGRKRVLVGAGAIFSAGLMLFGSARVELFTLCSSPLIGAGCAGMQAVAAALSADLYPAKRGIVLNACQVAFAVGAVAGPGVVYLLLENGTRWQTVYFGMSALAAAVAGVIACQPIVSGTRDAAHEMSANVRNLLRQPVFIGLCAAQLMYAGAEVGFFEWMPTYFDKTLHAGGFWIGKVVSVFWIAMMVGRLILGALLGRFETLKIGIFLALAGASASLMAINAGQPLFVMLFVALTGLCFGGIFSTILVEAGDRYHSRSVLGTVVGGISAASNAGTATIPWGVGALAASCGAWRPGLCLVPASALLSAGLMGLVRTWRTNEL